MTDVPIRDAATVMLVRDGDNGDGGLEVFMLRRTPSAAFAGGAYVFPGGAVDDADRHANLDQYCSGRSDDEASKLLEVDAGGLAFWVAAVRESFEEAGVLVAECADGSALRLDEPEVKARFLGHRRDVYDGTRRLVDICADEDLCLAVGGIHYFSHWITPPGQPRRFDTRFFLAAAPDGQEPLHDDGETVASCWVRPADALARHRAGEFDLMLPTIRNLMALDRFHSAAAVLAAAAAVEGVPLMEPRVVGERGGFRILLPGDPGYDDAVLPETALVPGMPLPGRPGGPRIEGLGP